MLKKNGVTPEQVVKNIEKIIYCEKKIVKCNMGIKTSSARLLAYLKRTGESALQSVCMLGRQELCMTKRQIKAFCRDYRDVLRGNFKQEIFCENFLKALDYSVPDTIIKKERLLI